MDLISTVRYTPDHQTTTNDTTMTEAENKQNTNRTVSALKRILALPTDRELFESQVPSSERESTTFCRDFMTAELYGIAAIRDTFNRAFAGWKNCYKYLTELAMTLNHRLFFWHETAGENDDRTKLYRELWKRTDAWGYNNLKGEELSFFLRVLD